MKEDLIIAFKKLVDNANSYEQFKKGYEQFKTEVYSLTIRDNIELTISSHVDGKNYIKYKHMKCDISFEEKVELENLFLDKEKELLDIKIENEYNELRKYIFE